MSPLFVSVVALSLSGSPYGEVLPPPPPPPVVVAPPHPNYILPGPYVPYLYPVVPAPVVIAHPQWYRYPGPAWWYTNNISPYHPVRHTIIVVPPPIEKKRN